MSVSGTERDRNEKQIHEWIQDFLAGDRHAFDRLVLRYQDRIYSLCFRFLGDPEDASDCSQEVFVRVFRNIAKFKFKSKFSTWLYVIAVNTCKNRMRSASYRNRKKTLSLYHSGREGQKEIIDELEDHSPSPLKELTIKERQALLQRAIDALPEDAKTVIILRDIEALSYQEIAEMTGWQMGTVKSKLARARGRLRDRLKGAF